VDTVEAQVARWRGVVAHGSVLDEGDVDELETHLRDQIADLESAGLTPDEAFLVAMQRIGNLDAVSREYAREYRDRLWKQLGLTESREQTRPSDDVAVPLAFATAAAVTVLVARLVAGSLGEEAWALLLRNASLLVLPFLAGFFAHRRGFAARRYLLTAIPFVLAALVINLYPFREGGSTLVLALTHLPVVLWFAVAHPYTDGGLRSHRRRMDVVRFTGEWCIYYVLLALGGGLLIALTQLLLEPTGIGVDRILEWVVPSGAAGAVIVAAWLVEAKQQVVENMAPVLTMVFTPLFAVMLAVTALIYAATGIGQAFDRELLGVFDALLVVVLGLVLYGMSARDPATSPSWMDRVQLVAVVSALLLDGMVLGAMVARIGELGLTPNRVAALGLNLVLLVNLAGAAWLGLRFVTGRVGFDRLERWQMAYLPVFAVWATTVVLILPPLFAFS
jgi:hypothetical protein